MKYQFIQAQHRFGQHCQALAVSRNGYDAWRHRPASPRTQANARLVERLIQLHRQRLHQALGYVSPVQCDAAHVP